VYVVRTATNEIFRLIRDELLPVKTEFSEVKALLLKKKAQYN
jgi:hypothetical protein